METQLLYLLSILMAVGFGYFVCSTMFRNERNGLIAQGRQAADAERAELEEQVKLQETRVQEIEKEREQDRDVIEKLRDENAKLRVLHNEADERVAEARRSTEAHWQQIVSDARAETEGRTAPSETEHVGPSRGELEQAVEEARKAVEEQWRQVAEDARKDADFAREQALEQTAGLEARVAGLTSELEQVKADSRKQVDAAVAALTPIETTHPSAGELRQAIERAETLELRVAALDAELEQARETAAAAPTPAVDDRPTQEQLEQAVAAARLAVEEQWQQTVAQRTSEWETTLASLHGELEQAREQARQATEAAAEPPPPAPVADDRPTYEQLQQAVTEARAAVEEQWQQTVAQRTSEWETTLASLHGELEQAREQASQAAEAAAVAPPPPAPMADDRPTYEQLQQAVSQARVAVEEQWQQTVAQRTSEWEATLASLRGELEQARRVSETAAEPPPAETPATGAPSHESMLEAFRSVAAEALHANNEKFLDLARVALERIQETARPEPAAVNELIDPIRETLAKVDSNLGHMEQERQSAFANLTELVNNLIQQGRDLRQETTGIARALRPAAAHGRWGELQLRRVVELAGMVEHCDYEEAAAQSAASGQDLLRPEMIVHLPNRRDIVVDANVSLSSYLESLEAADEATRAGKLREHAASVRAHLQHLSGGAYWSQFSSAPEFVIAFLPSETVYSAALEQDPALIEFGAENRVILATPTTLIALLKATAYGWQQQQLADNARAVSELGKTLYERLVNFTGHMDDLRRNLERSVDSYNRGAASLESRVLSSARRFQELVPLSAPEIPVLDPVETLPRSLQALDSATGHEISAPPAPAALKAPTEPAIASGVAAENEVPVIEFPIVPPMAPVIVCEPRVVSEAHVVSEPRVVSEPNFVNEDERVVS